MKNYLKYHVCTTLAFSVEKANDVNFRTRLKQFDKFYDSIVLEKTLYCFEANKTFPIIWRTPDATIKVWRLLDFNLKVWPHWQILDQRMKTYLEECLSLRIWFIWFMKDIMAGHSILWSFILIRILFDIKIFWRANKLGRFYLWKPRSWLYGSAGLMGYHHIP